MHSSQGEPHGRFKGAATGSTCDREISAFDSFKDAETIASLYRDLYPSLLKHALSLVRSKERADDAVQSAFLSTIDALKRGNRIDDPERWLHRCVRNACLTELRRKETVSDVMLEDVSGSDDPVDVVHWRDRFSRVNSAIGDLPPHIRTALLLSEVRGYSYDEIASEMQRSVESVRSMIFRARRQLRATIGSKLGVLGTPVSVFAERLRPLLDSAERAIRAVLPSYFPTVATAALAIVIGPAASLPATVSEGPYPRTTTPIASLAPTSEPTGTRPEQPPAAERGDGRLDGTVEQQEPVPTESPSNDHNRQGPGNNHSPLVSATPAEAPGAPNAPADAPAEVTQLPPPPPVSAPAPDDDQLHNQVEYPASPPSSGQPDDGTDLELGPVPVPQQGDVESEPQVAEPASRSASAPRVRPIP